MTSVLLTNIYRTKHRRQDWNSNQHVSDILHKLKLKKSKVDDDIEEVEHDRTDSDFVCPVTKTKFIKPMKKYSEIKYVYLHVIIQLK